MKKLNQEQVERLYYVLDLPQWEVIERGVMVDNQVKLTIRDTKTNDIKELSVDFDYDLKKLDFVINGIKLSRDEK